MQVLSSKRGMRGWSLPWEIFNKVPATERLFATFTVPEQQNKAGETAGAVNGGRYNYFCGGQMTFKSLACSVSSGFVVTGN